MLYSCDDKISTISVDIEFKAGYPSRQSRISQNCLDKRGQ
jgi:hypothetical protein